MTTNPTIKLPAREQVIYHAPVVNAKLQRKPPSTRVYGTPDKNLTTPYFERLAALGIPDPANVRPLIAKVFELREQFATMSRTKKDFTLETELSRALAAGEITPVEAAKRLAKAPDAAVETRRRTLDVLNSAGYKALQQAIGAIGAYGEAEWMKILKALAAAAVEAGDVQKFDKVHALYACLRSHEIAALHMAATDPQGREDLPLNYYRFERWDLAYVWRVENAKRTWDMTNTHVGNFNFIMLGYRDAPELPPFTEHPEWKPTLMTAIEALKNAHSITLMQAEEIATATPETERKPETPRKRMVAM